MVTFILKHSVLCIVFLCTTLIVAVKEDEGGKQPRIGNFALPSSLQPGPLFALGQNIITKDDTFIFGAYNYTKGKGQRYAEVVPSFLYAIKDDLSFFLQMPVAADFCYSGQCSHGFEDLIIQLEYAFHTREFLEATHTASLVVSLLLPLGIDKQEPMTGFGSPSFFVGGTASHLDLEWYYFASGGGLFTTAHDHKQTKIGNQFLYQAGIGKNIAYCSNSWIFTGIIEFLGVYMQKNKMHGVINQNSGGNIFSVGPSLWFSTKKIIVQGGIECVVSERLFGRQLKNSFLITFSLGWKF